MTGIENRLWAADYWLRCTKLLMKAYEQNKPDDLICCLERLIIEIEKYSEDQPRDDHGRWTSGGGAYTSGAISGALNPDSKEAQEHAKRYYEAVRHMKNDYVVLTNEVAV